MVFVLALASATSAEIGFKGSLIDPPRWVTDYKETRDWFSAAMSPPTYAYLSPLLLRNPKADTASFENKTVTLTADYYRRGKELIPLTVDADPYLEYRKRAWENRKRGELVQNSVTQARQQRRGQGLSVGIDLPKRFDQIFGEGGGNLRVTGYRRITFSGRSQWNDAADSDLLRQSRFPSLNMEQVSRFEITGTIGTKITVRVSQDSQTDIPLANRIQIRYKGDEDDILKSVEAGNTNLSLPNTRFVGYSSRIQGLFGLKAEAQLGNLRLVGIASQEKGSSERASISSTGEEAAEYTRDYQYVENRIFDLVYPGEMGPNDTIQVVRIYQQDRQDSLTSLPAKVFTHLTDTTSFPRPDSIQVFELSPEFYDVRQVHDRGLFFVVFNSPQRYALGLYMEIDRYDAAGNFLGKDTVGNEEGNVLRLRYIRPDDSKYVPSHRTWDLMWRNAYRIPKGVAPEDIDIKVFRGLDGREGHPSSLDYQQGGSGNGNNFYVQILGIDQYNRRDQKIPDNIVDDRPLIFEPEWGLLIFPDRRPFASDTTFVAEDGTRTPRLNSQVPSLYEFDSNQERAQASQYYLQYATSTRSNVINLNRANIIEGSERVTLNGRVLQRGTDYNITYDFGRITLLTDEATDPNADIDVEFEYAPFLAVQKKTLLGARAEYQFNDDLSFGSTVLYKSDKAQDRKPRVGQETARAMVLDFDGSARLRPNFLTAMVDALPLVTTEAQSGLTISGEIAQSRPNPNIDGEAYVDDFETSQEQLSLSTTRSTWSKSSRPNVSYGGDPVRGKMIWHNMPSILWEEVYDSERRQGEGSIRPMRIVFQPQPKRFSLDTTQSPPVLLDSTLEASWGGIMRNYGSRVDATRAQLLELRVKGGNGILHFDFGIINEDIDGDRQPFTEDSEIKGNNSVTVEEDVGLDGLPDSLEIDDRGRPYDPVTNPDPAGDNWWFEGQDWPPPVPAERYNNPAFRDSVDSDFSVQHYEWINGTEGNREDPTVLGRPDKEDLNSPPNGLQEEDAYFSFKVNLASDSFLVEGSTNENGWRTYRIPIRDSTVLDEIVTINTTEEPSWNRIENVRVWMETPPGEARHDTVEIAAWYFVQSNWQDTLLIDPRNTIGPGDSTGSIFFVASISDEENADFEAPPGVEPYYDQTNNVTEAQRALSLNYENLQPNDTGMVTKELISIERYSGYRNIEMYVHGPDASANDTVFFFFRVGRDHDNFYEYHTTLHPGWDERNWVDMDFNVATALKDSALRALENPGDSIDVSSGNYRVVGRPNINEVRFFAAGVVNKGTAPITGDIWLDELRVTNVRNDVGTAYRLDLTGNAADLLSFNFGFEHQDPFFRGISAATRGGSQNNLGSGETRDNMNYGVTLQFHKFLPRSWNARIPIAYSFARQTNVPLLRTNSDIVLPDEIREEEKSTNETQRFSISESFSRKGSNPIFSVLLNRQKVTFSYTRSDRVSVNNPVNFAENYSVRGDYDMGIRTEFGVPIFFWTKWIPIAKKASESKLYLFPNTWNWSGGFSRSMSIREDPDGSRRSSLRRDFNGRMNLNYRMFDNLTMSFNYSTKRDLSDPDLVRIKLNDFKLGLETNYSQNFRAQYDPKLFSFLGTNMSYSSTYTDNWDRSTETRNSNMSRTWTVTGSFDHQRFLGGGGGPRGGRGRGGRGGRGQAGGDTGGGPAFYEYPLIALRTATGWIKPVSYNYSESYRNSLPAMLTRPGFSYRLGLKDNSTVERASNTRNPAASESINYDFGSGFTLLGGIATDVRYRRSESRDLVKAAGERTENRTTGWPDLGIRITRFTSLPLIQKYVNAFIKVFSPRTSYSRQIREDFNIDRGFVTSKSESVARNPLLAIDLRLMRSLTISANYAVTNTNSEQYNPSNGQLRNETKATRKTISLSSRYSFSAPGGISIPLFGKVKFQSQATIDVNVKFSSDYSETASAGGDFAVGTDKSDLTIQPVVSYQFSQQIKGGLSARWQDTNDVRLNRKSHVRELQIWAEIRF